MKDYFFAGERFASKTFNSTVQVSDKTSSRPRSVTPQRLIYLKLIKWRKL